MLHLVDLYWSPLANLPFNPAPTPTPSETARRLTRIKVLYAFRLPIWCAVNSARVLHWCHIPDVICMMARTIPWPSLWNADYWSGPFWCFSGPLLLDQSYFWRRNPSALAGLLPQEPSSYRHDGCCARKRPPNNLADHSLASADEVTF